jgi:uncharacterized circularly permuted ATP-grasp superfamily protein
VLEDNCRTPSGVSYMLENREIMMRMFPELFRSTRIAPVDDYPDRLRRTLHSVAPAKCDGRAVGGAAVAGRFSNSAYYEHSFLADQMGIELVEGQDLFVQGDFVFMRTTEGPEAGRRDLPADRRQLPGSRCVSGRIRCWACPGLMNVYRSGGVAICSAPGAGVADDKAVYTYVPEMIRFYLGEAPILKNVHTWKCADRRPHGMFWRT